MKQGYLSQYFQGVAIKTLESAISINQTNEMMSHELQLVLPSQLHVTYSGEQRKWIMKLVDFTELVLERQQRIQVQ
jgi:hypothetical protein